MNLSFFSSKAWVQQALTKKLGTFGVIGKKKISKFGKDMHEFLYIIRIISYSDYWLLVFWIGSGS